MSPAKQEDVARLAGVSRTTVSRVLNNVTENFTVRAEVRERIWAAAETLGYRPNAMAQMLRRPRSGLVGWFGAMYPVGFSTSVLDALAERLSQEGLLVSPSYVGAAHAAIRLPWMRLDAAVISGIRSDDEVTELEQVGLPYVCINCVGGERGSSVIFDDAEGMRLACEHLASLGHRGIAYAVPTAAAMGMHVSVAAREKAYGRFMEERGWRPVHVEMRGEGREYGDWVPRLRAEGITALVAYSGHTAILALGALQRAGLRVPQDVSLIAFNDDYPLRFLEPSVSVLSLDGVAAGRAAAECVLAHLENPRLAPQRTILSETLVVRQSTGPAKNA